MKNILVIGSTGQIGSELTMKLRKQYHQGTVVAGYIPGAEPTGDLLESGPSEIVNVTGYATDYGVTIKSQDVNTYKTYYKSLDVYLKDNDGVHLVGEKVSIEVNGTVYERTVSPRGYASLAITMQPGEYDALISYDGPFGKNQTTAKITVKKTLFSSDLEEYYGYATFFNVTGLDENGTLLKESSEFNFCIDGTLKDASSNKEGVCAFNISSLKPGKHSIISYNIRNYKNTTLHSINNMHCFNSISFSSGIKIKHTGISFFITNSPIYVCRV